MTITGTERGDAAFDFLRSNPLTTREEVIHSFCLTLEESTLVFDAFESWKECMED